MRRLAFVAIALAAMLVSSVADASIVITVDKSKQRMTVAVDGVTRWDWPVSTGRRGHATPAGSFQAFRMERDHFSREWDDAPMPHSIFFTKRGHAIHGSYDTRRLGTPASAGCVRLNPDHARELFTLVEQRGVLTTTVVIAGVEPSASAPAVAKQTPRALPQQTAAPQQQARPRQITPIPVRPRIARQLPQYDDEIEYVAPRSPRPVYAQPPAYRRPQPGYEHLPPPPPGYYYAPQPMPPAAYYYYR